LGCPIDTAKDTEREGFGWFLDETRPAHTMSMPRSGRNDKPLREIRVGFADAYTGIDINSFKLTADFDIGSYKAGDNLAGLFVEESTGIWEFTLKTAIEHLNEGVIKSEVKDNQGNVTRINRTFSIN
jgi:hypothetical protein